MTSHTELARRIAFRSAESLDLAEQRVFREEAVKAGPACHKARHKLQFRKAHSVPLAAAWR